MPKNVQNKNGKMLDSFQTIISQTYKGRKTETKSVKLDVR